MNKRVGLLLLILLMAPHALRTPFAAAHQRSKGVVGSRQVVIINNCGRVVEFGVGTPWGWGPGQLNSGDDVTLNNVTLIRVAGKCYRLEFTNRYELRWNAQNNQAYVVRLVTRK
jgi:hypothetical protein